MSALIALHNPFDRPLHFLGLEVLALACFGVTLAHAIARYRRGERHHLLQWLAIVAYGVAVQLVVTSSHQGHVHGEFTVQLHDGQLPLYAVAIYCVFHYTGIELAERLRLRWLAEAFVAGFAICLLDIPFDILGPDAGWWGWSAEAPMGSARWLGVPVTSYFSYIAFGAILTALCRVLRRPLATSSRWLMMAPVIAAGAVAGGLLASLPLYGLRSLGVPDGVVVGTLIGGCALLAFWVRADRVARPDLAVSAIALVLPGYCLALMLVIWSQGGLPAAGAKLASVTAAAFGLLVIAFALPVRPRIIARRARAPRRRTAAHRPSP